MAVPEQTPYKEYVGNGVTTNFALGFACDLKQELKVFINNIEPELSTWSLVGGSVVFTTAPSSGSKIVLKRATKLERTTNYSSVNNSFQPEAINKDFDRVWYAIQDQNYKVGQYDFDYSYAINTSNQALSDAATAQQRADDAYNLADTTNTETRPIERGGTGASTAAGARTNLNVYSQNEVDALVATGGQGSIVGVSGGGTGSGTAAGARTNLDVMSSTEVATAIDNATPPASETTKGIIELATQAEVNTGTDDERAVTPQKMLEGLRSHLNASGSAPIFSCRAWVNFNGTGTPSIRASGNVSSISDNGTGDYTVNFLIPVLTNQYSAVSTAYGGSTTNGTFVSIEGWSSGSLRLLTKSGSNNSIDSPFICVQVVR